MSKLVKDLITKELASRYAETENAVWIQLVGVDGNTTNAFRSELRGQQMQMEIVKNSLFRRAVAERPLATLAAALEGPAALVTGGETAIDVAKLLDKWAPKFPKDSYRLRGAVLEGEYLDENRAKDLHKMPTRQDVQAQIAGQILSPGGKVAGAILSGGGNIAACIKAMIQKLEDGEEITKR